MSGSASRARSSGSGGGEALAGAHGDDHQRHLRVGGEEARAPALAEGGAVDAQQHGGARDAVAVQCVDDGDVRRPAARPLAAPEVDGELGLLAARAATTRGVGHACALEGDEAVAAHRHDLVEQRLDARPRVDRDRDDRQVLGEREQPVGVQMVLDPEARDAAQDEARAQAVAGVEVGQRIGQEAIAGAVALAEVRRQLQRVGHRRASDLVAEPHAGQAEREADERRWPARGTGARPRPGDGTRASTC